MEFEKKVGKTFLYYGFTVKKKFYDEFVEMFNLSLENLQSDTILHLDGEPYPVQARLVNQNRTKTTKLKPGDHPPRLVIQISYQSNKSLLQKFEMLYCNSKEYFDRNEKPPFSQKAYFKIESNGQIYCTTDETMVQKSPSVASSSDKSSPKISKEAAAAFLERLWALRSADELIQDYLENLIATDEEEKKPENIDPYFRNMEGVGGIHFWQLQQCIEELASILRNLDEDLDALEARWRDHELFWGRYLSTGAIEYARRRREDPEYDDGEFSMDWFANVEEDPQE